MSTVTYPFDHYRLTSLSRLQEDILQRLGLGVTLYAQLEIQAMGT